MRRAHLDMLVSYLAEQASQKMEPTLCSKSILTLQDSFLPQKGQSKMVDTLGFAFGGGALAFFRLPLQRSEERNLKKGSEVRVGAVGAGGEAGYAHGGPALSVSAAKLLARG